MWFTFTAGMVLGLLAGVFGACFFLLDDMAQKPPSVKALPVAQSVVKRETGSVATRPAPVATSHLQPIEIKPMAVAAKAVTLSEEGNIQQADTSIDEPEMTTVKNIPGAPEPVQ